MLGDVNINFFCCVLSLCYINFYVNKEQKWQIPNLTVFCFQSIITFLIQVQIFFEKKPDAMSEAMMNSLGPIIF